MFSKKVLGTRIKALRTENNIKQDELGAVAGIGKSSISQIEKGDRAVSIEVLYALSDYFNVSTDYLLGKTNDK